MTSNEIIRDQSIKHNIMLQRLTKQQINDLMTILNQSEEELEKLILNYKGNKKSLEKTLAAIASLRIALINNAFKDFTKELIELSLVESEFQKNLYEKALPVIVNMLKPDKKTTTKLINNLEYMGDFHKNFYKRLAENDFNKISQVINIGISQGETNQQLVKRVIGTKSLDYKDGILQITRNQASTLVRTAISSATNKVRDEFYKSNADIIRSIKFTATLDGRTTFICMSLDGKVYKISENYPTLPLHYNERSIYVAVIDNTIYQRPLKPVTEKMLLRQYTDKYNLKNVSSRNSLPYGHKTKFDKYANAETRKMIGFTPSTTNYKTFLQNQSAAFQKDVLGETRYKLYKQGGLSVDKFVDFNNRAYTIDELRIKHKEIFDELGL